MSLARVTRRLGATAILVVATACTEAEVLTPVPNGLRAAASDLLLATATSGGALVLHNLGNATVYWLAADQEALALIDWAPCSDPSRCEGIAPRATIEVPRSRIVADQPGSRAVTVYHWRLVPHGAAFRPDSIRSIVVPR